MKTIILTTRYLQNPYARNNIPKFIHLLSKNVKMHPGFINGKSFWSNDRSVLFTITEWRSNNYWNEWLKSDLRNNILKDMPDTIKMQHETIDKFEHPEKF